MFNVKKLQNETLGEYLLAIRRDSIFTLEEVSTKSGVPIKFLTALESGQFKSLPADVYTVGFLRKISKVYGADEQDLIAQFKKEKGIVARIEEETVSKEKGVTNWLKFSITPKLMSFILGSAIVLFTVGWLVWQVAGIKTSPTLIIDEPVDGLVINESFVRVKGRTDPGSELTINRERVFVEKDGTFNAVLGLSSGQRDLVVESINKFRKQSIKQISIVVDIPDTSNDAIEVTKQEELKLSIITKRDLPISLTVDDNILPTEIIKLGEVKEINAKSKIVILTPDAGNTEVILNGKDLGKLGKIGETLTVPFTREQAQ